MISICPILLPLLFSNCFINNFLSSCLCWFWIQCPNSGFSLFKSHLFASWWSWNLQCSTCQPFPASLDTMSYFLTFQFYSSLHALSFVSNCFNSKNILYSVLYLLTHFPNCRFSLYTFESLFASKIRLQLFKLLGPYLLTTLFPGHYCFHWVLYWKAAIFKLVTALLDMRTFSPFQYYYLLLTKWYQFVQSYYYYYFPIVSTTISCEAVFDFEPNATTLDFLRSFLVHLNGYLRQNMPSILKFFISHVPFLFMIFFLPLVQKNMGLVDAD